ncbi:UV radiation resistance protein and autophagy-related subunit 14-domain-containing protein [Aspergillus egyptiacus]|nr:UV radiation resistance protein and autophagy-related subunit 14-domain-containing protein [Aspergillus egyptiacus]
MSCDICARAHSPRLQFLCPTCARNQLYDLRFKNATFLLERERLSLQIEAAVNANSAPGNSLKEHGEYKSVTGNGSSKLWTLENITNKRALSSARQKAVSSEIEKSAKYQLAEREAACLAGIQNNIKRTDHLWHSLHSKTAEARIFLCREVASLYGLRQKVKKRDNGPKESYMIGGVSIIDLRDLNGKFVRLACATPAHISTSFSYVAHILVLISHYLSLRLPAEITLPHRNYPSPTIYTPSSSYQQRWNPSSFSEHSLSSSTTTPRASDPYPPPPRARPLCIDKALPKLAKEDPMTYALFIEGVSLLAWNVSWLCRSQGLNLGSDSWEDVCDVGRNLWQLLVAPPGQPTNLMRAFAGRDLHVKIKSSKDSPRTAIQRTKSFPMLGHYSHGTAHSFLSASEGTEFIRNWRLPTPTKIADKLKSTLMGEMASAEWELLDEDEWGDIPQEWPKPPHECADGSTMTRVPQISIIDTDSFTSQPLEACNASARLHSVLSDIPDNLLRAEITRRNVYRDSDSSKPACGSVRQGAYNTPAHVMALFLILFLSTLACSFPILARRFPRLPIPRRFLFLSRHFGTGVLIATAFVHLLPTAFVSLTDPCLPRFWSESYKAMAGFIAMISVFAVVLVEMFFAMKGAGHVHGSEYDQLMCEGEDTTGDHQSGSLSYSRLDDRGSTDDFHLSPMSGVCSLSSATLPDELNQEGSNVKEDDDLEGGENGGNEVPRSHGDQRRPACSHHRQPQSRNSHVDSKATSQNLQRQLLQCLLLEAGILFHSIFIGMAVSVATGTSFVVLLVAICFHQTFEGFALGSRIASLIPDLFPSSSIKPWLMSLAYGTTTPIGQAIGLLLHNLYDPASTTGLLMVGITNAISSGLLLFAGLVELLAEDFLSEDSYVTLRGQRRVEACLAVSAGALLMAFVGAFA